MKLSALEHKKQNGQLNLDALKKRNNIKNGDPHQSQQQQQHNKVSNGNGNSINMKQP